MHSDNKYIRYKCGCCFSKNNNSINFNLDLSQINLDCKLTWDLIGTGNTKGCFQLESRLGQSMAKKLKPNNIEQLSALISILRPGCLEAYRDGKSVSNHYIDKKNNLESIDYYHPSLKDILGNTYGEMIYQEQAMEIAQKIAGFNLQDADMLRKAIGKKKPEEMAKVKQKFLDGCKNNNIVTINEASEIFAWIEKSQRYSFNKSHAVSYAINAYVSAYTKTHFPIQFFLSYLKFAKDKIDPSKEIYELVNNCREMHIDVLKPDIRLMNKEFIKNDKDNIYFGLTNIKGVGESVFTKLENIIKSLNKNIYDLSYLEMQFLVLANLNSSAIKNMISVGCFDYFGISRKTILFDFDIISNLTDKERSIAVKLVNESINLKSLLLAIIPHATSRRHDAIRSLILSIDKPAYSLEDTPIWIADIESQLLGISISCSKIDEYNLDYVNTDCRSINAGGYTNNTIIGIEIKEINIIKTKRGSNPGQEMAFMKVCDNTGSSDVVIFPEEFSKYKNLINIDTTAILKIEQSKNKDSAILKKMWLV